MDIFTMFWEHFSYQGCLVAGLVCIHNDKY
jgi:hypothetical protein